MMNGYPKKHRRRDQPRIDLLNPVARFLNNLCAIRGKTQASLAEHIGMAPSSAGVFTRNTASPATISRWFRGDAVPTDEDLQRLSTLLEVPVQNFFALRFLEDVLKKKQPTVVSIGAWHYLASA